MPDEPLTIPEAPAPSPDTIAYAAALELYQEQLTQFKCETLVALENRKSFEQEYDKLVVSPAGGGLALTFGFVEELMQLTKSA